MSTATTIHRTWQYDIDDHTYARVKLWIDVGEPAEDGTREIVLDDVEARWLSVELPAARYMTFHNPACVARRDVGLMTDEQVKLIEAAVELYFEQKPQELWDLVH